MSNELKARIQALDARTKLRCWVDLEMSNGGATLTILDATYPGGDYPDNPVFVPRENTKVYLIRDQLIGFLIGYVVSTAGDSVSLIREIFEKVLETRHASGQ